MQKNETFSKDLNVQAAQTVRQMADLGWFDTEYTMYGCAYLNTEGVMCYRISSEEDDIYHFIEKSTRYDIFPSNVKTLSKKYPVPAGMQELVSTEIKKDLAKECQKAYPRQFFETLYCLADSLRTNSAKEWLWQEASQLEGKFEEHALNCFENLVHYTYSTLKLTHEEYQKLLLWIEDERKNMDDNFVSKDMFEKNMYGFCYLENGQPHYLANAQRGYVYRMAYNYEEQGKDVGNIYSQTYWYNNYQYRLTNVVSDFKKSLQQAYPITYMMQLKKMKEQVKPLTKNEFFSTFNYGHLNESDDVFKTLLRYGKRWGIL